VGTTLFLFGAAILTTVGLAHGALALRDFGTASAFTPTDDGVREAMSHAPLRLAPQTSIWLAWQGFNLSHSLGLIGLGSIGLALGIARGSLGAWSAPAHLFFALLSAVYFVLAVRFWFRAPATAAAVATVCFLAASFFD
jgi:hypothetical protein